VIRRCYKGECTYAKGYPALAVGLDVVKTWAKIGNRFFGGRALG